MASSSSNGRARRHKVAQPRSVRGIIPYTSEKVFDLLAEDLGEVEHRPRLDGTSELVWTILSQHTSDLNAGRAYDALVERFPSWQQVVDAPTELLIATIRHGGLAQQKAPRIQAVLTSVRQRRGDFNISIAAGRRSQNDWCSPVVCSRYACDGGRHSHLSGLASARVDWTKNYGRRGARHPRTIHCR
jgi:hypothetical protein